MDLEGFTALVNVIGGGRRHKKLVLSLEGEEVTMQKASALKQAFNPNELPNHLVLSLGGIRIQPKELNCIVDGLKIACPKKLKLRLHSTEIGTDVSCLAEFIVSGVELESFELDLDDSFLNPENATRLAIALTKSTCQINHLSLSLADNATMVKNGS